VNFREMALIKVERYDRFGNYLLNNDDNFFSYLNYFYASNWYTLL